MAGGEVVLEGNPYQELLGIMQSEAQGLQRKWLRIGVVTGTGPLRVRIAGTEQSGDCLWVNEQIQNGHVEKISLMSGEGLIVGLMNGDTRSMQVDQEEDRSHLIQVKGKNTVEECLKLGDRVLVLSEDDQVFFVLCKVVRA